MVYPYHGIFSSVQSLSCVRLFATPWTAACQASLSITNSRSLLKLMSIESVMPSSHLILCCPLPLLPSIFPSIRVFSNESVLHIRWPKYWSSTSASVLPMNSQDWFPFRWTGWISLQSKGLSRVFSNTTVQKHQFFSTHHAILFIFKEKWSDSFYNVDESQKHNGKWKELITKDHMLYDPVIWSHLLEISRTGKPIDTESKCMIASAGRRREEWMTA